jgi:anti-sigma28 factor (negative regulator of flagellin synthesis)
VTAYAQKYDKPTMDRLRKVEAEQRKLTRAEQKVSEVRTSRDAAVKEAVEAGATLSDTGRAADGMRHSYVRKIASR